MELTDRQKLRHLARRLAFGATPKELAEYETLGLHKTIDRLIDYGQVKEAFAVSPWGYVMGENDQVVLDVNRAAAWWAFRMSATRRPSQEKLTLFWHNHFAVSGSKVENHPMMLQHLDMLRNHANGTFRNLLGQVTRDPAMLRWLDSDTSILGKPNENFAREVLELFTVGIGNYSEKDVKELARAFTGWSIRSVYRGGNAPGQLKQFLLESVAISRPIVASSYSEGFHDEGPKTILGKTARFDTESALDLLAFHPNTAKFLCGKLWTYYAYPNPEPRVVERLVKSFTDSKGDIKQILLSMVTAKEFWSERAFRTAIKSPADLVIPLVRQLGIAEAAIAQQAGVPNSMTMSSEMAPTSQALLGVSELINGSMRRMGMRLLYPPDVAGWEWGPAWVSPAMMTERIRFATTLVNRGRASVLTEFIRSQIAKSPVATGEQLVDAVLDLFDADFPAPAKGVLMQAIENSGGVAAFQRNQTAAPAIQNLFRLVFAAPEFQMC